MYKLVFFLFVFAFNAYAKELAIETIDIAPFGLTKVDGKISGMIYEISNKIAETAGFPYKNTLTPYPRTIIDLKNGKADFVIRYTNAELDLVAIPVATIVGFPTIIVGKSNVHFKTLNDLHGKTVGIIRGGVFDSKFANNKQILKYDVKDYEQMFKMLVASRIDAIIGSTIGIYYNAKNLNIPKSLLSTPLFLEKRYFVLHYSKLNQNPKIIAALKKAIATLNSNGEINKIVKKYEANL